MIAGDSGGGRRKRRLRARVARGRAWASNPPCISQPQTSVGRKYRLDLPRRIAGPGGMDFKVRYSGSLPSKSAAPINDKAPSAVALGQLTYCNTTLAPSSPSQTTLDVESRLRFAVSGRYAAREAVHWLRTQVSLTDLLLRCFVRMKPHLGSRGASVAVIARVRGGSPTAITSMSRLAWSANLSCACQQQPHLNAIGNQVFVFGSGQP